MKTIYITHCSAKKNSIDKGTPDQLYASVKITRFISRCKQSGVNWAIFSDKYGLVFPDQVIENYEKHPSKVTNDEFEKLAEDAFNKLKKYDVVYFYFNPGRFHKLYRKLIDVLISKGINIKEITHLKQINNKEESL
jgi:hypothetical protein